MAGFTTRPVIVGTHGVVSSGHYLASLAGVRMLERGGNAIDAAAAMGFALAVLEPHLNGIGGEVPILIYTVKEDRVIAISGQGPAPLACTIDWMRSKEIEMIPGDGLLPAVVPSVVGSWIEALARFGTMSLSQVLAPAIEIAEEGFPIGSVLTEKIASNADRFIREWPTTARTFLPGGRVPEHGDILQQPGLARTLRILVQAEKSASQQARQVGLNAARMEFYAGKIAADIVEFVRGNQFLDATGGYNSGLLSLEDFSRYHARVEDPVSTEYDEYQVFKCNSWTQGPVFLQQLNILEGYDLDRLGHNSADYIHLLVETAKLAFADREAYYGDPDFDHVPMKTLLSEEYAKTRRQKIDMEHASMEMTSGETGPQTGRAGSHETGDTTQLDAIDKWGNMVSATQSGGWIHSSPLIGDLGFALSTRGQMFHLTPGRNNSLAPGKRPRTTLTPSLAFKSGKPHMVFGTPGGDQQDQWSLQFFLNFVVFKMNLQEALDAPSFHTLHFPSSFYPRKAYPGKVEIEELIPAEIGEDLKRRGHVVSAIKGWQNGRVLAVVKDLRTGTIMGAASPKMIFGNSAYALGW